GARLGEIARRVGVGPIRPDQQITGVAPLEQLPAVLQAGLRGVVGLDAAFVVVAHAQLGRAVEGHVEADERKERQGDQGHHDGDAVFVARANPIQRRGATLERRGNPHEGVLSKAQGGLFRTAGRAALPGSFGYGSMMLVTSRKPSCEGGISRSAIRIACRSRTSALLPPTVSFTAPKPGAPPEAPTAAR